MRWLISYADMVTLLFALFLVLFALTQSHPEKIPRLAGALENKSERNASQEPAEPNNVSNPTPSAQPSGLAREWPKADVAGPFSLPSWAKTSADTGPSKKEKLLSDLQQTLVGENLGVAEVELEERGVMIALLDTPLLFESGKAELKQHGKNLLARLVPIAQKNRMPIRIEGHTDNVPIHNGLYASNWELSVMRSAWVTRTFVELGISPERLAVMGYGSSRARYSNAAAAGRAGNRRVEIVFLVNESGTDQP